MAEMDRDAVIALLRRDLAEMRRRKGPHSVIARTLEDALLSGTDEDLRAGIFASTHFLRYYEQLTLAESGRQAKAQRAAERRQKGLKEWAAGIEEARTIPRKVFEDAGLPDGPDFSRPDSLSTARKRHWLAKTSRVKRRSRVR
jgi:hypothetical protein